MKFKFLNVVYTQKTHGHKSIANIVLLLVYKGWCNFYTDILFYDYMRMIKDDNDVMVCGK